MQYKPAEVLTHEECVSALKSGNPNRITEALLGAVHYEQDWRWVQETCLRFLTSREISVRSSAAECLGELSFLNRPLDHKRVLSALYSALSDLEMARSVQSSITLIEKRFSCSSDEFGSQAMPSINTLQRD